MTPQELSDIDRQVAEAIGDTRTEHQWSQLGGGIEYSAWLCLRCGIHSQGNNEEEASREIKAECVREFSTSWDDAMFAAEKAALFLNDGATIYQRDDKFWAIGFAGSTKLLMDESGPLCVARAILKLKGGK
jgi:hypothetical protein